MTKNRLALGRGLAALIPGAETEESAPAEGVAEIEIRDIKPNPFQPRSDFPAETISELAASIKESGLLQPVVVRKENKGYALVSGERRLRAFKLLKRNTIPAIIRTVSDVELRYFALLENLQREDLNEIEQARGFEELINSCGVSHDTIAKKIGKSRSAITNSLRLLKLPLSIQHELVTRRISMGHARALLTLGSAEEMEALCGEIIGKGLSVRETEARIRDLSAENKKKKSKKAGGKEKGHPADPDVEQLKEKLQYTLGTQVKIVSGAKGKGRLEIEYYGNEDLSRICDIILK